MNGSSAVMMAVGLVLIVAGLVWLLVVTPPLPMWIVLTGGGLVFLGAGAALRRQHR
jgi:hypothetical protein